MITLNICSVLVHILPPLFSVILLVDSRRPPLVRLPILVPVVLQGGFFTNNTLVVLVVSKVCARLDYFEVVSSCLENHARNPK